MTRPVRVTIGALVLRGFPAGERGRLAAGLQRELAALLRDRVHAAPPAPVGHLAVPRVRGTMTPGATPEATGARAARLVARQLPL